MLKLRTLGECVVELDGEAFGPDSDALFAILLYLGVERGRQVSRSGLAELIWPRLPVERGRHCLRQLLYRMRCLGLTVEGRDSLILRESFVLPTFAAWPTAERLTAERIAGTFRIGHFLPGYFPEFSTQFSEWVERTRGALEARVRRVLLEVAHSHRLRGEWDDVDALCRDCLRLDPLNEEATLALAEALAMTGGKAEAMALLKRYEDEVGPEDSPLRIPAAVLRRRIAERFPTRRYAMPAERCFVGRAPLVQALTTELLRARKGEGGAVLLTGPAGIGKTRLVQELIQIAGMQGVRLVRVSCVETDLQRPMAAFTDAVPQMRSLPGALGVSPDSISYLTRLTEFQPGSVFDEPRDPQWIAGRIRQAIVDLADAVAHEKPILFVIEDAHWLDAASWAAVLALLEWIPPKQMLMVLTTRGPHPTDVTPQGAVEKLPVLPVTALDPDAAMQLVRTIAADHGGTSGEEALSWCVEVGEGNPLFLRELVVHCLEGGATHVLPLSLRGLLDARLDRVSSTARQALQASIVLGELSTVDRLARMLELPAHLLLEALAELGEALLLDDSLSIVAPRHELVAVRISSGTSRSAERFLHRRAAESLEAELSATTAPLLWECAAHWRKCGDPSRGLQIVLGNVEHVLALGAIKEALSELARLRATNAISIEAARRIDSLYAECLIRNGNWSTASAILSNLIESPNPDSHPDELATNVMLFVDCDWRNGADRASHLPLLLGITGNAQLSRGTRLHAARDAIVSADNASREQEARQAWESIQDLRPLDERDLAWLSVELVYHVSVGDLSLGASVIAELLAHTRDDDRAYSALALRFNIAEGARLLGETGIADQCFSAILRIATRLCYPNVAARSALRLALSKISVGATAEARRYYDEARTWASELTDPMLRIDLADAEARVLMAERESIRAMLISTANLHRVLAIPNCPPRMLRLATTTAAQAELDANGDVADSVLESLAIIHARLCRTTSHDRTVAVLCDALISRGHNEEAAATLREYLTLHRRGGDRLPAYLLPLTHVLSVANDK